VRKKRDLHDLPTSPNRCIICCDKQKGLHPIGVHISTAVILSAAKDLWLERRADPKLALRMTDDGQGDPVGESQ